MLERGVQEAEGGCEKGGEKENTITRGDVEERVREDEEGVEGTGGEMESRKERIRERNRGFTEEDCRDWRRIGESIKQV